ncbi:MAG: GGDEF domain-containing protein, partial [Thiohalospira sp.]
VAARREIARCERSGRPLAFILADIDDFKAVNDRLGHDVGDGAIRHVSAAIAAAVRSSDIVSRWGGEEFLVALPESTLSDARSVAERIRRDVAARPVETATASVRVTMTLGVAAYMPGQSLEQCLARADDALYSGKRTGKNVVQAAA